MQRVFFMVILSCSSAVLAGPLAPPVGPVAPTPGPEPRVVINAANTPGDADSLFRITQPGSYYLTSNVTGAAGLHGIEIATDGVSIDLMGFSLTGVPGSQSAIFADGIRRRLSVRQGSVFNWGFSGIGMSNSTAIVEGVHALNNGFHGIAVGSLSVVKACVASHNANNGIDASTACTVSDCTAASNAGIGIYLNSRSVASRCAAEGNTTNGFSGTFGAIFTDCVSGSNDGSGFVLSEGCVASRCSSSYNDLHGISAANDCALINNNCDSNGVGAAAGAGIRVTGTDTRIEGNNCTDNDIGVQVSVAGSIVVRNTCSGNGTNWEIVIGNAVAPIVQATTNSAAISGSTYAGSLGSTDPNANVTY